MKTIFLSGSRNIKSLNDEVRTRIQNMMSKSLQIVVGDANGADKAFQKFLKDTSYKDVVVFCSGSNCRNNLGKWKTQNIFVDPKLKGRDFYTQKDKEMAGYADCGLILWDGKSVGSISNVFELLKNNKYAVVYFSPEKKFYNIKSLEDAQNLLKKCDEESMGSIQKKINLSSIVKSLELKQQDAFAF
tara:strand:+ start:4595 stop:5155 length:561 start_codon:yes stop_codon:yes gene_type:complete